MGKRKISVETALDEKRSEKSSFLGSIKLDPNLASLFSSSLGPVNTNPKIPLELRLPKTFSHDDGGVKLADNVLDEQGPKFNIGSNNATSWEESNLDASIEGEKLSQQRRRRKRKLDNENLEASYLSNLEQSIAKEHLKISKSKFGNQKRQKRVEASSTAPWDGSQSSIAEGLAHIAEPPPATQIPHHETVVPLDRGLELDKASRTVFLANVSTMAIKSKATKKKLIDHLESSLQFLPRQNAVHKIESIRFRSIAFSASGLPKRAAFIKKELMDSTSRCTNAYAIFSTQMAAREAVKNLNGSIFLDRHLRVDSVAYPAAHDHRRCVFVGNIGFVDDESTMDAARDEESNKSRRKIREPADVEEGLWRQFSKAGVVESVRVIRDRVTRVGKGFAYIQFQEANAVEKALLFDKKRFPPMLPRSLRVTRAKHHTKSSMSVSQQDVKNRNRNENSVLSENAETHRYRVLSKFRSSSDRANKSFGRAGVIQRNQSGKGNQLSKEQFDRTFKLPESTVFEGYRARSKIPERTVNRRGTRNRRGKPRTRSSRRGAAFKALGKKKKTT